MTIINPWKSPHWGSNTDFEVGKPVFSHGEYSIYKLWEKNYLYAYKNTAFRQLAGRNDQLLIEVATRTGNGWLYERSLENLARHSVNAY